MSVEFLYAGTLEELKRKGRVVVRGPHRPILLISERDRVYALDNRCPHMGFPLDRGSCEDGILTCHWHHLMTCLSRPRRSALPCTSPLTGNNKSVRRHALSPVTQGRHILIAVARYLAAHFPTQRALLQTADIATRLTRGGELHREA